MADAGNDEPTIILCRVGSYMQASMIKQILEGEGVPSFTEGDNFNALYGSAMAGLGDVKIHVRRPDRFRAIEILTGIVIETGQRIRINGLKGEPKCPTCGYILYYARDQRCPECGREFELLEVSGEKAEVVNGVLQPKDDEAEGESPKD